jgi:formamidopyrimidine-DNA glycosylase
MPELPEVETVRRGLATAMDGARFLKVTANRPDLRFPLPQGFRERLEGATVVRLDRRGKYLVAPMSTGEALIMHLGMSGRFTVRSPDRKRRPGGFHRQQDASARHDHVRFEMRGPGGYATIDYNDPRRFGFMDIIATERLEASPHFAGMGPEPLGPEFNPGALSQSLSRRKAPLKSVLLDQAVVAGLGNIYVCEALFAAGLSPRRLAATMNAARARRLHAAIVEILSAAVAAGGSTLRDFAASDGSLGYFQHRFRVYDREGEPCGVCGRAIRRIVQAGRSTFYCGFCQR